MLNYIWVSLIVVGVVVAIVGDTQDQSSNKFRNGVELQAEVELQKPFTEEITAPQEAILSISSQKFIEVYGGTLSDQTPIHQGASVTLLRDGSGTVVLNISDRSPAIWREMSRAGITKDKLTGRILSFERGKDEKSLKVSMILEPINFVRMKAVTQAALDYAAAAVNIALGLIGIMALWLGIMRIADEAGAVKSLARLLRPVMKFLFPDVPSDHPAVGSMIMNMSANMLGLSNAATPLGLKAMEELDKLNPKKGIASNAMCTFLAINTAGLTLIPATAIAVRAAAGSSNPTIIVGTTIVGGLCSTVVGVVAAKLLQRLPVFKRQLETREEETGQ